MNYFDLFGLPVQFEVDQTRLTQVYKALAQVTHPDKFATASSQDRLISVQKNSQVNDGYQILKKPISRAEHLLHVRGVELKHEQQTMQDPEFLMQQMEWREKLEDIQDNADAEKALADLDDEINVQFKAHIEQVRAALDNATAEANIEAAAEVRKLKFLDKLRHEISDKEEAFNG